MPLREAFGSLSIAFDLDHKPRGLLSSARLHETSLPSLTTSLIVNCNSGRLNCNGTFQYRPINEATNPEADRRMDQAGARVAHGVFSSWSLFRRLRLRFSVAAWREEAPGGGDFWYFSLDSCPARIPLVTTVRALRSASPPSARQSAWHFFPDLLHSFGGFAPRAWRVSAGRRRGGRGFFGIALVRLVLLFQFCFVFLSLR